MVDITERRSALESHYTAGTFGAECNGHPGVMLAVRRNLSIVHVAGKPDDQTFINAIKSACGCDIPFEPGSVSVAGSLSLIWLAADRWMAVSAEPDPGILEATLRRACDDTVAVIDASHASTVLRLSGPQARTVLMKGAPLDFHARTFTPGRVATTMISQCTVTLVCIDQDTFDLYVFRSFAQHMWEWLRDASEEFGYEVSDILSG